MRYMYLFRQLHTLQSAPIECGPLSTVEVMFAVRWIRRLYIYEAHSVLISDVTIHRILHPCKIDTYVNKKKLSQLARCKIASV